MRNSIGKLVLARRVVLTALSPLTIGAADSPKLDGKVIPVELKDDNYRAANFVVG
ncbi:MAG: hypothetical protein ACI9UA_004937 [Pseudoalteromonas tetraodonis]|jgi:hypothetical protein